MLAPGARGYRFCGETIVSSIALPPLLSAEFSGTACTIEQASPVDREPVDPHWFHHWRIGRQRPWLSFARRADGYLLRFPEVADFLVSADGARIRACPSPALPRDTLCHLLVDQVLPLALSRRGRLLLHASAVDIPGIGALAFAGPTGRGKSTLAAALAAHGGRILADDCLAIESHDGRLEVQPAYPGLRLWPDMSSRRLRRGTSGRLVAHYTRKQRVNGGALRFQRHPSPLRALFLVSERSETGPAVKIRRCRASARLMGLIKYTYLLDIEDRIHLARTFERLAAIVTAVPVLRLRVRNGHRWLQDPAARVFAHAQSLPPEGGSHHRAS